MTPKRRGQLFLHGRTHDVRSRIATVQWNRHEAEDLAMHADEQASALVVRTPGSSDAFRPQRLTELHLGDPYGAASWPHCPPHYDPPAESKRT